MEPRTGYFYCVNNQFICATVLRARSVTSADSRVCTSFEFVVSLSDFDGPTRLQPNCATRGSPRSAVPVDYVTLPRMFPAYTFSPCRHRILLYFCIKSRVKVL